MTSNYILRQMLFFFVFIDTGMVTCVNEKMIHDIQLPIGNFALPASRQPSPLFSLGQNLVDKNELLLVESLDGIKGRSIDSGVIFNSLLYGLSDRASLFLTVPIYLHQRQRLFTSQGLGDISLQAEVAVYEKEESTSVSAITFLANIQGPTGSINKLPVTGTGAWSFFLGATASHISVDWYLFTSYGFNMPGHHADVHIGNQFFYEYGLGRNLGNPGGGILLGLLELNGVKTGIKTDIKTGAKTNSKPAGAFSRLIPEGNILFFGPSLYWSTKKFALQAGFQVPIFQNVRSNHNKISARASIQFTWRFASE